MKNSIFLIVCSTVAISALADEATPAHQFSATTSIVSDYIFRGVTQTWHRPAVQGSIDYAHASGLSASLWASTVSEKTVAGANAEIDLAIGYKRTNGRVTYGVGLISVFYPGGNWRKMTWGARADQKYDFTEANVFVGYDCFTVKYSQALNDLMGFNARTGFSRSTKGARYIEVNADVPLADTGVVLGLHAGRQDFGADMGNVSPDANDYRISLGKNFAGGWSGLVQLTENSNKDFFNGTVSNLNSAETRNVGKRRFAVSLTKSF